MSGTWAAAAGRRAGGGNVGGVVNRVPTTEKKSGKKKAPEKTVDFAAAEAAALQRIAVEVLEHAMESKDLGRLRDVLLTHGQAAAGTDAHWRAQMMQKELLHQAKQARKAGGGSGAADAAPAAPIDPKVAERALESAMATDDLVVLKAAIAEHEEAAEDSDALEHARAMLRRLVEERKAEKKKRLKEGGAKEGGATEGGPTRLETGAAASGRR